MSDSDLSGSDSDTFELFHKPSKHTDATHSLKESQKPVLQLPTEDATTNVTKNGLMTKERDGEEMMRKRSFNELGLAGWVCKTLSAMGIDTPTPVQARCIPPALAGAHVLASAQTGSGKTAAFLLPILQKLASDPYGIYALIITPTRELACQINEQLLAFGSGIRVKSSVVIGGVGLLKQSIELAARPHFIVATPGRLLAHLDGPKPPFLKSVKYLVLDEADRLVSPEFEEIMREIITHDRLQGFLSNLDNDRQMFLFSATMTKSIQKLRSVFNLSASTVVASSKRRTNLFEFHATEKDTTVDTLDQRYLLVPLHVKYCYLTYLIQKLAPEVLIDKSALAISKISKRAAMRRKRKPKDVVFVSDDESITEETANQPEPKGSDQKPASAVEEQEKEEQAADPVAEIESDAWMEEVREMHTRRAEQMIVFASTCEKCELICQMFVELKISSAVSLHSGLTQNRRLASLGKFKAGLAQILVATDVAARGLDIPKVELVINFDMPRKPEDFIHRAGRTARIGRTGRVISFVTKYDVQSVLAIEQLTGKKMGLLEEVCEFEEEEALKLLTRTTNAFETAKMQIESTGRGEGGHLNKKWRNRTKRHKGREAR